MSRSLTADISQTKLTAYNLVTSCAKTGIRTYFNLYIIMIASQLSSQGGSKWLALGCVFADTYWIKTKGQILKRIALHADVIT